MGLTFVIATKVTKSLGPKPPKAENPGGTPKIRKLAVRSNSTDFLTEYRLNFLLRNAFSSKGPWGTGVTEVTVVAGNLRVLSKAINGFGYRTSDVLKIEGPR